MYHNLWQSEVWWEVLQVKLREGWASWLSHPNTSESSLSASGIHLENKSSILHAFGSCIYTDMKWAMKLREKRSPCFYCTDLQKIWGSTEPGTLCVFPPQKLSLVHVFPHCTELMMMAAQWVVGVPENCKGDEVPSCFSVAQKSLWGSWIALGFLTEACATIIVWLFFSWR